MSQVIDNKQDKKSEPRFLRITNESKWDPSHFEEIGGGGESTIFLLKDDIVAKIFLQSDDSRFVDNKEAQKAAELRLEEMQTKLYVFPRDLPKQLVAPTGVLVYPNGYVFGYTMPFRKGTSLDKLGRTDRPVGLEGIAKILLSLYDTIASLHAKGVVIGDLNENNIIVARNKTYIIDADSMQFGGYECHSFMPSFTDPKILQIKKFQKPKYKKAQRKKVELKLESDDCDCSECRSNREETIEKRASEEKRAQQNDQDSSVVSPFAMKRPHSELTDWYAFLVIAMRLLTFTDPYGGVVKDMPLSERMRKGITVFDPKVTYPVIAVPLREVDRSIVKLFFQFFHQGKRFIPERRIFELFVDSMKQVDNSNQKKEEKEKCQTTQTRVKDQTVKPQTVKP